eukprot:gb/GECG01009302.1/.p1 GENE.gb/GECG01009302.1/~~gb/GECG01009302.1/.p1  ORF type:complete len:314 (+),score=45.85 gb/GECG01009302.1/:1-942(+)
MSAAGGTAALQLEQTARDSFRQIAHNIVERCQSEAPGSETDLANFPKDSRLQLRHCLTKEANKQKQELQANRQRLAEVCYQRWASQRNQRPKVQQRWYSSHEWCPTCNLMKHSPCSSKYMFFNSHREWRREFLCLTQKDLLPEPDGDLYQGRCILESVEAAFANELDSCAEQHYDTIMTEENFKRAEDEHDKAVKEIKEKKGERYQLLMFAKDLSVFESLEHVIGGNQGFCRAVSEEYRNVAVQPLSQRPQQAYDLLLDQFVTLCILQSVAYGSEHSKEQSEEKRNLRTIRLDETVNAAAELFVSIQSTTTKP